MEHYEEILNYFPNAQIETIDDAGHDVHVENRSVFVEKNFGIFGQVPDKLAGHKS